VVPLAQYLILFAQVAGFTGVIDGYTELGHNFHSHFKWEEDLMLYLGL
jgi:hypothetical protein